MINNGVTPAVLSRNTYKVNPPLPTLASCCLPKKPAILYYTSYTNLGLADNLIASGFPLKGKPETSSAILSLSSCAVIFTLAGL